MIICYTSYSPTSTSAIPYTQTYGIQEAYNYAVSLQNYEYPADIVLEEGVYTINESIIIPLEKYGQAPTLIGKGINTQIVPSSDFSGSALMIGSWHGSTSIFPNSVIIKDLSIYASNSDAVDLSAGFERAGSNKSGIFNCNINAPSGYYAVNADKIENINLAYGDYNGAVSYQVPDGTAIITAVFIESEGLTLVAQQANLIDDVFSASINIVSLLPPNIDELAILLLNNGDEPVILISAPLLFIMFVPVLPLKYEPVKLIFVILLDGADGIVIGAEKTSSIRFAC